MTTPASTTAAPTPPTQLETGWPSRSLGVGIPAWFAALVVLSFWLLARPYLGLRHDGVLYMGQALLHLQPAVMAQDLFFANGSQDRYSLASNLLAVLYSQFGLASTQIALLAVSCSALMAAVWLLLRTLPSDLDRWLGLAALAVCSHSYGGLGIFAFAETFVTGRTLAEPLALLAIVLAQRGRVVAAVGLLAAAALAHPLIAIPAAPVVWILLCQRDKRWRYAGLLAAVPLLLAALGVAPFSALFTRYDAAWWAEVETVNRQVLLFKWEVADWQVVALDLGLLALAAKLLPPAVAGVARATLIATAALMGISFLGADVFHDVLITQLQLWRVLWISHLLALACMPALAAVVLRREPGGLLATLALGAALVASNARWNTGWAFIVWAALTLGWWYRSWRPSRAVERAAIVATALVAAALSLLVAASTVDALRNIAGELDRGLWMLVVFASPALALPAVAGLFLLWRRGGLAALAALCVAVATVMAGATQWDRRSVWMRYIESSVSQPQATAFGDSLPPNATVYWHGELSATWAVLKRASYFSSEQGAGLLFQRTTALEFHQRQGVIAPINFQQQVCRMMAGLSNLSGQDADCAPTQEVAEMACQARNGPDYLVLERRWAKGLKSTWTFSAPDTPDRTFYLYDCLQLR